MNRQRKFDEDVVEAVEAIGLAQGWVDRLLDDLSTTQLELILAYIANEAGVSTASFKRLRTTLPSFSKAKWEELCQAT
jgi:hypothetical protein